MGLVEILAVVLVVSTTIGLAPIQPGDDGHATSEMERLTGTVTLSTASAMAAIGLAEFDRGAVATFDLAVDPISATCEGCEGEWRGWRLHGDVVVTELIDDAGRLGRVEATISATHLLTRDADGAIARESLHLIWTSGGESTEAWSIAIHDPPRWHLDDRSDATFVEDPMRSRSRTGPHLSVTTLDGGDERVVGCLPESFACTSLTTPEIDLTRHMGPSREATTTAAPVTWDPFPLPDGPASEVEEMAGIRTMFGNGTQVPAELVHCPWSSANATAGAARLVDGEAAVGLAPLSSQIAALGLHSPLFRIEAGTWTEASVVGGSWGSLVDTDGGLRAAFALR